MKLDNEKQRENLLAMLSTVVFNVTPLTIDQTKAKIDSTYVAIQTAEIEGPAPAKQKGKRRGRPKSSASSKPQPKAGRKGATS